MAELVLQSVSSVLNDALRTLVQERLQEVVDLETLKKRVHEVVDLAFDDLHSDTLERAEMVIAMALSSNEAASRGAGNHHGRDELDNDASQRLVQSSATRAALRCAAPRCSAPHNTKLQRTTPEQATFFARLRGRSVTTLQICEVRIP